MDNPLISPNFGLIFWQTIILIVLIFLLGKFAWKPMLKAIKAREERIDGALNQAEKARREMEELQASNESLLQEARAERDKMLKEARETREKIVAEAKTAAKEESDRIVAQAQETIKNEKMAAITELKSQVASLSIEIAEKILKDELSSEDKQKNLAENLVDDLNLN